MAFGDHKGTLTASVASVTNPTVASGSVAVVVGDLVFVNFGQQTALTATAVTDNLGNTYVAVNAGTDAGTATMRCFYSRVTVAGTLTAVNVAATASTNDASCVADVIEGPFVVSPLDANPVNATDATTPFTCTATGVLAQADEVVMAAIANAATQTFGATSPLLIAGTVSRANISTGVGRQVVAATTSVTPVFTGTSAVAVQTTASFKKDPPQPLTAPLFVNENVFGPGSDDTFWGADVEHVAGGEQFLTPDLYADADTFFAPTVTTAVTLTPALYTDADTFFSPTVTAGAVTLTPALYTDADTFFSPTVTAGVVTLTPALYTDADTFFSPSISAVLTPALYVDADTFFAPTVTAGAVTLTPALYTDADTFFSPTVTATYTVLPALYTDADTFFAPTATATYTLLPNLYTDADTFFAATVTAGVVTLLPSLYTDADTFFSPTVTSGEGQLFVDLFTNTNTFFTHTVTAGAVTLTPNLYVDADTFFGPTVTAGAVTLLPNLYTDADTFFAATITQGAVLSPALFTNTNTFFTPTVTAGAVTLLPGLYTDADVFFDPTVTAAFTLLPNLYVDADTFFAATVTVDPTQRLFPDEFVNGNVFFTHLVEGGAAQRFTKSRRNDRVGGVIDVRANVATGTRSNVQSPTVRRSS